jgi:hypothetical protein
MFEYLVSAMSKIAVVNLNKTIILYACIIDINIGVIHA